MMITLLGVGVGVSLGAIWMISQARKREALGFGFTDGLGDRFEPYQEPHQLPAMQNHAGQLGLATPRMLPSARPPRHHSAARTLSVGGTSTQVVRALGSRPWKVQVRTVSPPGAYVLFATSNNPSEGVQLVAGDYHNIWLSPGEDLYAQTQDPSISAVISVSGGEEG